MIWKTPVHDLLRSRSAEFGVFDSWEVADHFGDPAREYAAIRESAGLLDMSHMGKLRVTGRDRVRYLHNMLSNDIRGLADGSGCHAALLTHQGRLESDLHCLASADELWLVCPAAGHASLCATLRRHIIGDQVEIEDWTDRLAILSLQGPAARPALERLLSIPLSGLPAAAHRTVQRPSGRWIVALMDRTGCGGCDLWLPAEDAASVWTRLADQEGMFPAGRRCLDWLRTEAGIPWFGVDMDDRSLPMVFGLDSALSLTKGCYRGQEIVARIRHRGRLDRRMAGLVIGSEEAVPAGSEVHGPEGRAGHVTSCIPSPRLGKPLALAVLKLACAQPGFRLTVALGDASVPAEVVALPLG
ncbi:MAG: aminomethyl transferase family protein [Acidobacteria bacterium]|nr:aminomethyl transferase family protein [Acidobacteriota bacterium]